MRIGDAHLTYCTNIHAGESWAEVLANIERHVVAVKQRVAPDEPFGVGLRLSARAAAELAAGDALARFEQLLAAQRLYVFTINGFPYGPFHGTPVKDAVYRPDWTEPERVAYTNQLADLLARLLPDGVPGTISTVPGCFRARVLGGTARTIADHLARCAAHLADLEASTGKRITLALEPEPCCSIETLAEAVDFFAERVDDRRHLGVCLDTCHAAVEFEQLAPALDALRTAGIAIAKVQLSAGLAVTPVDDAARAALARYTEDVYLHQVVARRGHRLQRYVDLPEALADPAHADEWRIHFHVPIFRAELGPFTSTQPFLGDVLATHRREPITSHFEVETYTWDVLPPELRDEPIADAVARELRWVLDRLR
jgi:sugar phosphate isomerase/epimerase